MTLGKIATKSTDSIAFSLCNAAIDKMFVYVSPTGAFLAVIYLPAN